MSCKRSVRFCCWVFCLVLAGPAAAQRVSDHAQDVAEPVPPPLPPKQRPDDIPEYKGIAPQSDLPWGLQPEMLEQLYERADVYRDYSKRFTCDETARVADYNASGGKPREKVRHYGYLLVNDPQTGRVREYRQEAGKNGELKPGAIKDEEPFPPAYAWVYLFSRFNEPYFSYRYFGDRFDGFDWIHEIQFRGSVPFTDGKDIRQWEGMIILDAVTLTPLEIRAEPVGQAERIESLYRSYNSAFNLLGFRTKPKPRGYNALVQFRKRQDQLTFPTELRYDTFQAVSTNQVVPVRASTRTYRKYRFIDVTADPETGDVVDSSPN